MHIIESFCVGKLGDSELCEDMIVVTDAHAAIVDGVSDKTGRLYNGVSAGRFAAAVITHELERLPPAISFPETLASLRSAFNYALDHAGRPPADEALPAAVFVVYSAMRHELWRLGDTSFMINGDANTPLTALDDVNADARATVLRAALAAGASTRDLLASDPGRASIFASLRAQHRYANDPSDPLGYAAFNGNSIPGRYIEIITVSADSEVVLASDGYPRLHNTLAATEDALARDLTQDPLRIGKFPSLNGVDPGCSSFDDRSYIRLRTD
jgi:hypothetical protein